MDKNQKPVVKEKSETLIKARDFVNKIQGKPMKHLSATSEGDVWGQYTSSKTDETYIFYVNVVSNSIKIHYPKLDGSDKSTKENLALTQYPKSGLTWSRLMANNELRDTVNEINVLRKFLSKTLGIDK